MRKQSFLLLSLIFCMLMLMLPVSTYADPSADLIVAHQVFTSTNFLVSVYIYKAEDVVPDQDFYAVNMRLHTDGFQGPFGAVGFGSMIVEIHSPQGICDYWQPTAGIIGGGLSFGYHGISFVLSTVSSNVQFWGGFTDAIKWKVDPLTDDPNDYDFGSGWHTDEGSGFQIESTVSVGFYTVKWNYESTSFTMVGVKRADVAVTSVTPSPTFVRVGEPVTTTVGVENQGGFAEAFDVTAYYVEPITTPTPEQWDAFWSMGDVNENGYIDEYDLSLIWDHIGTSDPQYDINKSGEVTIGDYMICGTNQGKNIWTYFGTPHFIGKQTVSNLAAGGSTTLTFTWNTAGVPPTSSLPKPYTIKAVADTVPGEIDIGDNTYVDGAVGVYWVHDVAVTSVTPSPTSVRVGDPVTITVKAENQGDYAETFSVTTYYGSTAIGPTQTVTNLAARSSTTLTFTWNTAGRSPGTYTIKAIATTVQGETDTADNTCTDGTVTVEYHDVAIGNIDPWPIRLNIGYSVRISVYTWNQGNYNETFSVTTYYGSTAIGPTQTVTNLAPGSYKGLLFTWDTTGMSGSQAGTYTIKAVATTVAGETDTADNTGVDGVVTVKVPGDANFDRHVDMTDFYIWREYFGKSQWPPEVDPDFDNNGYVEMPDYYIWANNFGLW